jgi:hypothetical protein
MHLDERLEKSREVIGKQFAVGQAKVSSAYNKLWADMEAMRKAQRERQEEQRLAQEKEAKQPSRSTLLPSTASIPPNPQQANRPHPKPPRPRPAQAPTSRHGARGLAKSAKAGPHHAARRQHTCPYRLRRQVQARSPATSSGLRTSGAIRGAWTSRAARGRRCRRTTTRGTGRSKGRAWCFLMSRRRILGKSSVA